MCCALQAHVRCNFHMLYKYSFALHCTTFCSPFLLQSNRTCYLPLELPSGANGGCKHEVEVDGIAEVIVCDRRLHVVLSQRLPHVIFAHAINLMASKTAWSTVKRAASASNIIEKHQHNDSLKVHSQCYNMQSINLMNTRND